MKTRSYSFTIVCVLLLARIASSQVSLTLPPVPKVDFDAYEKLVREVKEHRKTRLIDFNTFKEMSTQEKVIVLDTRSDEMYKNKHVKGAIHLNFSDFTQANLAKIIPSPEYKILIYCNNNFDNDEINFASKAYIPPTKIINQKTLTLALNIPTYINLYGYGYKNVYELGEFVSVNDERIEFEGTSVFKRK